jgi:hypothetical protein
MQSRHYCSSKKLSQVFVCKGWYGVYNQDKTQKEHKHAQAQRLAKGAAGAAFGNLAHLLDAANYVKWAWDSVTSTTISNAWKKAEIILTFEKGDNDKEEAKELDDGMFNKILQELANISITEKEINEFLNSDNANSVEYIESIMEDRNDLMNNPTMVKMMKLKQHKAGMMNKFPLLD